MPFYFFLSKMASSPIYTRRVTAEQMKEESRAATAAGMRELAAAAAAAASVRQPILNPEDDDSEVEFVSDDDDLILYEARKRRRPAGVDKSNELENRIRYLTLDLTNAQVDLDDARTEVQRLTTKADRYKRVNDELCFFKGSIGRAFKNTDTMTKLQLEHKFKLFNEEALEHSTLCERAIANIELDEVKAGMLRVLVAERKRYAKTLQAFKWYITFTNAKEVTIIICTWSSLIFLALAFLYKVFY